MTRSTDELVDVKPMWPKLGELLTHGDDVKRESWTSVDQDYLHRSGFWLRFSGRWDGFALWRSGARRGAVVLKSERVIHSDGASEQLAQRADKLPGDAELGVSAEAELVSTPPVGRHSFLGHHSRREGLGVCATFPWQVASPTDDPELRDKRESFGSPESGHSRNGGTVQTCPTPVRVWGRRTRWDVETRREST
ncbi:hypothetical protein N7539_008413 [Penicillium diatomitis]|uniref:Uncharacterized protein n=1 Tax=Penicillium diatomitis TaxID=2819901 RepID=A0A9X0BNL6_9EURO|nr:uncharacterized protein N7539_008413 [Penicillium diatomitis]KAJ5475347.1 hypothetical protein N7539_008413 [Penicillium diatomitis]